MWRGCPGTSEFGLIIQSPKIPWHQVDENVSRLSRFSLSLRLGFLLARDKLHLGTTCPYFLPLYIYMLYSSICLGREAFRLYLLKAVPCDNGLVTERIFAARGLPITRVVDVVFSVCHAVLLCASAL